jgi:uncharacterized protein YndB with AHSA1/START domain
VRVFSAFADPVAKARRGGEGAAGIRLPDRRTGDQQRRPKGGAVHFFECRYQDIVPNERIVRTYDMHLDDKRISVSLATVAFKPDGEGTPLIFTKQGVFLDGYDDAAGRERGTRWLLDKLGESLREPANA